MSLSSTKSNAPACVQSDQDFLDFIDGPNSPSSMGGGGMSNRVQKINVDMMGGNPPYPRHFGSGNQ